MEHPKTVGDRSTLAIMLTLQNAGFIVLTPFGENSRYDLAIDDGVSLVRVQCKTGRLRGGAVVFNVCSNYGHHLRPGRSHRSYVGQVDFFAVYCRGTAGVYLVPIDDLPVRATAALRVRPPRNGQNVGVRWAKTYVVGGVAFRPIAGPGAPAGAG
jgi:PD-(D/E)XK endonuclease